MQLACGRPYQWARPDLLRKAAEESGLRPTGSGPAPPNQLYAQEEDIQTLLKKEQVPQGSDDRYYPRQTIHG